MQNLILRTDSYKLTHHRQYPAGTTGVFSYFESRKDAAFDNTVFFGLQPILTSLAGRVVSQDDVEQAALLAKVHFGNDVIFNREGWEHIVRNWGGRLPVRIKAVPEGTVVPVGNVLMTVENTDHKAYWLTNALESLLTHVWYPSTVASLSRAVKVMLKEKLETAGAPLDGLSFMLHDFGYRGATGDEAAGLGGAGHLVNFLGTDTLPAMMLAIDAYNADLNSLAFSVPATEHSVMTALGREGEMDQVQNVLDIYPEGIVSVVSDSFDIYKAVDAYGTRFADAIEQRNGKFVVRPDSVTKEHPNPGLLTVDILNRLWAAFGGTVNRKGYMVLNPKVGVLWGDGIDKDGIERLVNRAMMAGFSPENLVFGMGGGLLQKVNRDTQRFAFKSSAQQRDGVWHDVRKDPLDASKASKAGRLVLTRGNEPNNPFVTVREENVGRYTDTEQVNLLETVFENGEVKRTWTFDQIRERAAV